MYELCIWHSEKGEESIFLTPMKNITWSYKNFNDLTNKEIYEIFRLRIAVFVVEQNCPYQDADGKDQKCLHVMGTLTSDRVRHSSVQRTPLGELPDPTVSKALPAGRQGEDLIAYARILPPTISYKEVSIGRVATSQDARRTGAGKLLMEKSMKIIKSEFGNVPVRISAQAYLEKFYTGFGFKRVSEEYLEDNIPHIEMLFVPC